MTARACFSFLEAASDRLLAQAEVEETFRWVQLPAPWLVVLVILPLVVLFVAFFYRRENPVSRGPAGASKWRWGLGALRALVIIAVLAMLAQPVLRRTTFETRDSTLVVLADDSLSSDIVDRYSDRQIPQKLAELFGVATEEIEGTTRYDLVGRLFTDENIGFLDKLREKGKVVVFTFAKALQEIGRLSRKRGETPEEEGDAAALGLPSYGEVRNDSRVQETRIGEALRDAVSSVVGAAFGESEETVSGVLLLSDGQENSGSGSSLEIARRLGERRTPVYTIGVGNPDEPRDLRLTYLDVNDMVLVDDRVPFDVGVVADGFEGVRVPVTLKVDAQPVDTKYIEIDGSGKQQTVRLEYRPRRAGEFTATAEIDKQGGEVFYDNNSISKTIRVLDQKIKVLYAENLPRWEYRYLKNALIRDTTMEAQVWLFSADPDFVQDSSPSVPPLRAFPRSEAELLRYHVIILGDVDPDDLGEETMALLKGFVFEGGGLVFIAGRNANPGRYPRTDLYSILPVEVSESGRFAGASDRRATEPFKAQLTAEGRTLPVMRLDNDSERNRYLWENENEPFLEGLPSFFWYAQVEKEKASAVVLARHPRDEHPIHRRRRVIFAYMNYGKGRSFFSAVDNTWRWRAGVDNLYLYRFWSQVIRFVASGRLLGNTPRFSVSTDKTVYKIGETVKVDCRIFDADMKPSTEETVTLYHQVQGREGDPPEKIELALNEVKGQGSYGGDLSASQRGRHDIWLGSETERAAFRSFTVEIPALESRNAKLNRQLLRDVARVSGGQYHELHDVMSAVGRLEGFARSDAGLVDHDDLWDEWWVLVLFTGLISLEWILRKMVRLQ